MQEPPLRSVPRQGRDALLEREESAEVGSATLDDGFSCPALIHKHLWDISRRHRRSRC